MSLKNTASGKPEPPTAVPDIELDKRLKFLGITPADAELTRSLRPAFEAYRDEFVETFYAHLFAFEATAKFLQDPKLVSRLKVRQAEHLASMLEANWQDEYVRQRTAVGESHAELGIAPELFLGAYNQYLQHCVRHFAAQQSAETREFLEKLLSLIKVVFLDVGLTLDAYFDQSMQTLRNALDMLWKANAELRQFAQLTSHDLKTPLATVANLCEETLDEFRNEMPASACQLIEAARKRIYRMSTMVDELLAITISPESTETNEEFPAALAWEDALERVRPELERKAVQVTSRAPLPIVWGNRVRLCEAFYNVLSNAAKFADKQPAVVEIGTSTEDEHVLFTVSDNGPGIPREELERIFSPFRRLPKHRDLPGSGLGLYFTKNLIERQGGRVWAESEPGHGSKFFIRLPHGGRPQMRRS